MRVNTSAASPFKNWIRNKAEWLRNPGNTFSDETMDNPDRVKINTGFLNRLSGTDYLQKFQELKAVSKRIDNTRADLSPEVRRIKYQDPSAFIGDWDIRTFEVSKCRVETSIRSDDDLSVRVLTTLGSGKQQTDYRTTFTQEGDFLKVYERARTFDKSREWPEGLVQRFVVDMTTGEKIAASGLSNEPFKLKDWLIASDENSADKSPEARFTENEREYRESRIRSRHEYNATKPSYQDFPSSKEIAEIQGISEKVGSFEGLEGASISEVYKRIPKDAIEFQSHKFFWLDKSNRKWFLKFHAPSTDVKTSIKGGWSFRLRTRGRFPGKRAPIPDATLRMLDAKVALKGNPILEGRSRE